MKRIIITLFSFILLFVIACEKDEETPDVEPQFKTIEKYFYKSDINYAKKEHIYKEVYLYDTDENIVEIQYHFTENYIEKTVYEYENGVLINIEDYDRNGEKKDNVYEIINNEFGQIEERIHHVQFPNFDRYKFVYNYYPNGNVKTISGYFCDDAGCRLDYTTNYDYDEEGNLIKEYTRADYTIYAYPEYDKYDNWIVQHCHIYDDLSGQHSYEIVEREIEYY